MPLRPATGGTLSSPAALLPRRPTTRRACDRHLKARAYLLEPRADELQEAVGEYCAAVNRHDVEALCSVLSPGVVWSDKVWCSGDLVGHRRVRLVHEELFTAYPDYELHILDNLLAQGNTPTVALHWTATGTNFGEWRGYPASGLRSSFSGVTLFMFEPQRSSDSGSSSTHSVQTVRQVITYRQPSSEEYSLYLGHEDM